jgi:amino acid adenylation domain-containing protein
MDQTTFSASNDLGNLSGQKHEVDAPPGRKRVDREDQLVFPISFAQQGLSVLNQFYPRACAYHLPTAIRILGDLDVLALNRSLSQIVRRHETLRTTFKTVDEQLTQFVAAAGEVMLPMTDLRGLEPVQRVQEEDRLITEEALTPFDLTVGPLMRVRLLRTGESEYVFVKVQHAIICDDYSDAVFIEELITAYEAFTRDRRPQLPELQIQYGDFAQWQRESLRDELLTRQLEYWRGKLADWPEIELPNSRPRPTVPTFSGAAELFELSPEATEALKNLGANEDVTLFVTLLTAFKVLLVRYCGQEDIVVGAPIANRGSAETKCLIGLFVNPVVMRTKLDGDPTFRVALRRVSRTVLEALEHADFPFVQLAEELASQCDGNPSPLPRVMFEGVKAQSRVRGMGGLSLVPIEVDMHCAKFDLVVELTEGMNAIFGALNYDRDLFDASTMRRMAAHFGRLLEGIAANPDARISELPLLTSAERGQLLVEWNNTHRDYPTNVLHELIEAQTDRTPDAIAVVFEGESFTYQQVNRSANQLAHRLRKLGVGRDSIVGIFAERSLEMIIGLLATLRAGAAYLPLDPKYPFERLAFMLGDAQPEIVLVQSRLRSLLPRDVTKVVSLEDDFSAESDENPINTANAEDLAYVIYTSGSTGRPKGVMCTHHCICNWLLWSQETYRLTANDCIIHKTPFTFDVSLAEIFWSLIAGSRLIVASPGLHGDSRYLIKTICEKNITAIHFVPSMLSAFLEDEDAARCSCLRLVICAGEALTVELQERFFAVLPNAELHNNYGPTEAGVVTYWQCKRGLGEITVPIGRPIANTQIYIMDRAMQPAPIGVPGELHIGGVQLARGYLARPELTGKAFIPNPFGEGRLYKTGDLARYRENAAIEFLGRIDQQVKLRGQRIELGEIEAVLKKHEAVRDCVVVMRQESGDAHKRLVAYVVADGLSVEELCQHAQKILPDYMVPPAVVFLQALPLTASGKLDRRALPDPGTLQREKGFAPPRDALETQLVAIWEKALRFKPIGITDNFFQIGGNSLLAVGIFAEIERTLGKQLPLATLLQMPTVERLASRVREATRPEDWGPVVAIQLKGSRPPFFGIHGRDGNVLLFQKFSELLGEEQPFYGLQAQGLDGSRIVRTSVETIAAYYLDEMRKVQPHGPYFLGGYSFGGLAAYEIALHLRAAGEEVALLILFETENPAQAAPVRSWMQVVRQAVRRGITTNRIVEFLAARAGGKLGDRLTEWNETWNRMKLGWATKRGGNHAAELVDLHVQAVHQRAFFAYRPRPYGGKVTLFRTLDEDSAYEVIEDLGWGQVAQGGVEVLYIPGTHLTIFSEENVTTLAEKARECIQLAFARRESTVTDTARGPR